MLFEEGVMDVVEEGQADEVNMGWEEGEGDGMKWMKEVEVC